MINEVIQRVCVYRLKLIITEGSVSRKATLYEFNIDDNNEELHYIIVTIGDKRHIIYETDIQNIECNETNIILEL